MRSPRSPITKTDTCGRTDMLDVIVDCTELYKNPVHTGIQRVVRELLRHWPSDGPVLHVARFEQDTGLVGLPETTIRMLIDEDPATRDMPSTELASILAASAVDNPPALPSEAMHLIPEVFYDPARCAFYMDLIERRPELVGLIAFDFIPVLYPWGFKLRTSLPLMDYFLLVQNVQKIAHISERTQSDYFNRILRGKAVSAGTVLPLGSDGLAIERQHWRPDRDRFVALGSIDGRKNQHVIIEAFTSIWRSGGRQKLTLIGRAFDSAPIEWMNSAKEFPQFCWKMDASDDEVANELRSAIATIYLSEIEGFGLPPVESLHASIPVIVTENVPSIAGISSAGQIRISKADAKMLETAVRYFESTNTAKKLWTDASSIQLPTWNDFSRATSRWISTS